MPRKDETAVTPAVIESRIQIIRGVRVMLDSELAELYGVPTHALNQAVDRNRDRSPDDFAFRLTLEEFSNLISQSVISSSGYGGRRKLPRVFTEHGVAMLSSVLRSPTAVQANIEIIRVFIRLRRLLATPGELIAQLNELAETVKLHDEQLRVISDVLRKMLAPPPKPDDGRRIGFHANNQPEPPPAPAGRLKGVTR